MVQSRFSAGGDATVLFDGPAQPSSSGSNVALSATPIARLLLPFASIGLGAAGAVPPPLKERATGTLFNGEVDYCAGQRGCPVITGAGARRKRIAGIKNLDVYAFALYVDQATARSRLGGKFRGQAAAAVAQDQRLFDELVASEGVEKVLRIVITSGLVKRKTFLEALEERLEPPLKQAGELSALGDFTRQFDEARFRKGLEIVFAASGGKLTTRVDGQEVGTIRNACLARALLNIYVGRDPVSKPGKEAIGEGLAAMVLA